MFSFVFPTLLFRTPTVAAPPVAPVHVPASPAEQRVARGVALLDAHQPGWAKVINVGILNIAFCEWCVLGQLYGAYANAWVFPWFTREIHSGADAIAYGFLCKTTSLGYDDLDDLAAVNIAWKTAITARQQQAAA